MSKFSWKSAGLLIFALMASLAGMPLSEGTANASQIQGVWVPSDDNVACRFDYLCADWEVSGQVIATCCIHYTELGGGKDPIAVCQAGAPEQSPPD